MKVTIAACMICLTAVLGCSSPSGGGSGPPSDDTGETIHVVRGDTFTCELERCGGCQYEWYYTTHFSDIIEQVGYDVYPVNPDTVLIGQAMYQAWSFVGKETGQSAARFEYRTPTGPKEKMHTLNVYVK